MLARLNREARTLLESQLAGGDPTENVNECIERVERLIECHAPEVIVDGEKRRLKDAADRLFADPATTANPHLDRLKERVADTLGDWKPTPEDPR